MATRRDTGAWPAILGATAGARPALTLILGSVWGTPRAALVGPQPGGAGQAACRRARPPARPPQPPRHRPGARQQPLSPAWFPGPSCLVLPRGETTLVPCEEKTRLLEQSTPGDHPRARRPGKPRPQPRASRRGPPCGRLSAPALVQKTHGSFSLPQPCQTDGWPQCRSPGQGRGGHCGRGGRTGARLP